MEEIYQFLQSGNEQKAGQLLAGFLRQKFKLKPEKLVFLQSAVSLNSFKGSFEENGEKYFFKTHIEQNGEVAEYAGAKLLEEAGYPIIAPCYASTEQERELLVYPWISDSSLFEVSYEGVGKFDFAKQVALDERLFKIYMETFERDFYEYPAVQQLFYKRLNGPRFNNFYGVQPRFVELANARWIINGRDCGILREKIEKAKELLAPSAVLPFSVIGHGDAHNGNVFLGEDGLRYFDPAYAGRMDPFLDLTKPIFHNAFARWMYFPEMDFELEMKVVNNVVKVDYECPLSVLEQQFLQSKMQNVVQPLVQFLRAEKLLPTDWENRFRSSLLCCPLLTMNLFRYPQKVTALGFARVMEMATFDFNPYLS